MSWILQSVLLPRDRYTKREATKWVRDHNYKISFYGKAVDVTKNFYRFRQAAPKTKAQGAWYKSKEIGGGIRLIYMKLN